MIKLLVVDDETLMRRGIIQLIDMKKLNISDVYEASNGKQALELAKQHSPDIILADINMPIMDGLAFTTEVKKFLPHASIAMITGYDYFDYAVTALKAGVDDYILKPVSKDDITILLKKLVEKVQKQKADMTADLIAKQIDDLTIVSSTDDYKVKIEEHLSNNIANTELSLKNLAFELGLSSGYLSAKFRDIYGQNFQDYLITLRIAKAKILLLSSDKKMYEIASLVGFEDPNYFSASFKKHAKISPSEFRKNAEATHHEK
jgi:two-component system, response regulator YesN